MLSFVLALAVTSLARENPNGPGGPSADRPGSNPTANPDAATPPRPTESEVAALHAEAAGQLRSINPSNAGAAAAGAAVGPREAPPARRDHSCGIGRR